MKESRYTIHDPHTGKDVIFTLEMDTGEPYLSATRKSDHAAVANIVSALNNALAKADKLTIDPPNPSLPNLTLNYEGMSNEQIFQALNVCLQRVANEHPPQTPQKQAPDIFKDFYSETDTAWSPILRFLGIAYGDTHTSVRLNSKPSTITIDTTVDPNVAEAFIEHCNRFLRAAVAVPPHTVKFGLEQTDDKHTGKFRITAKPENPDTPQREFVYTAIAMMQAATQTADIWKNVRGGSHLSKARNFSSRPRDIGVNLN